MNDIFTTNIKIISTSDVTFKKIKGREQILKLIKDGYQFTDDELMFIAKNYFSIFIHYLPPDSRYIRVLLKSGYGINRNQFPLTIFKDQDLLLDILNNYESLCNKQILKYVTIETLKKYAQSHSDFDFYRIFTLSLMNSVSKDQISEMLNDEYYKEKFVRGEEEYREKGHSLNFSLEEPFGYICTNIKESEDNFKIDYCKNVTLADEKIRDDERLPSKRKQDMSLWDRKRHKYVFFYISDMHLTHKIKENVDKGLSLETSIKNTVDRAVDNIVSDIDKKRKLCQWNNYSVLLIAGDVSYDYQVNELFYTLLREKFSGTIVVVLGNHELWNSDPFGISKYNTEEVFEKYRLLFENLRIEFLENDLLLFYNHEIVSYNSKEIIENESTIKEAINKCEFCIFGATGFSGLNKQFNASNGIYRGALNNIDLEKKFSLYTSNTFENVLNIVDNKPLICLTHMPYDDWYSGKTNINDVFFVNGHTHANVYKANGPTVYADNQIGYKNNTYKIKFFYFDTLVDIFANYPDGIFEIHFIDYLELLRYKGYNVPKCYTFQNSKVYLLRKNGMSMFISKSDKNKLAVLNGAKRKNLKHKDLEYYYNNLDKVGNMILNASREFQDYISAISEEIIKLGGSGDIHGCIVDIDFFNKLYVNPYDGCITAYSAPSLYNDRRIIYKSFYDLLQSEAKCSEIVSIMKQNYDSDSEFSKSLISKNVGRDSFISSASSPEFRNAYKMSSTMKKLQAFYDDGIVKIWPDNLEDNQNVKYITKITT